MGLQLKILGKILEKTKFLINSILHTAFQLLLKIKL